MAYSLRPYRGDDAEPLHALTLAAITGIGPAAYSRAQIDVWASRHGSPGRIRERVASGHLVYVAADEGCGYSVTHRRDFEIGGVAIHNYAMEKRLG